jgi:DNA-binding SARP family transcriptional activator
VIAFKTLAPSVDAAIARPVALAALRAAGAPARWLTGPSGSGKSTLLASHVRATRRRCAWYRLDPRDDDPAFFYAHFSEAIASAFPGKSTLPRFGAEDHADEEAFAARFVAAIVGRVGTGIVVLDDAHKATRDGLLRTLARLVARAERGEVWLVGERPPGAPFFDAIAARRLALCNDVPLAFSADECAALAAASRVTTVGGAELAALTGGHAGALVLACEMLRDARPGTEALRRAEEIHLHLLTRLVDGMPEPRRELLLGLAFAPQLTGTLAASLAGEAAAAELPTLHAHGLLHRADGPRGEVYEAHGLVRRGVQTLVRARLGEQRWRERAVATATALAANGYEDEAFALLVEHGEPTRAAELLVTIAPRHARTGQAALLLRALDALPAATLDAHPWLPFWAGEALLGIDEEAARGWFARAHDAFEHCGDPHGQRVAAARVVTAYGLEYGDLRGLDTWMERYVSAGGDESIAARTPHESVLGLGAICAAIVRGAYPAGFDAQTLLHRMRALVEQPEAWLTPDEPVAAARLLIDDARIFSGAEQAQALVTATRAIADRSTAGTLQRGRWCISAACAYFEDGRHDDAHEYFGLADALVERSGSQRLAFELGMARIDAELKHNALAAAAERLAALERLARVAPPAQRAEYARFAARVALQQGRAQEGLRWAEEALATATLAGYSGTHARIFQLECTYGFAANGRLGDALALALAMLEGLDDRQGEAIRALVDALRFLATGERDEAALRACLARASEIGFVNLLARAREPLARLCRAALAHDVEPAFVRRIIELQHLEPPLLAGPEWPYSVHVRTLGGFDLRVAGAPQRPVHKSQDKPLELLKVLVACQALGRESADKDWLCERLWPDADAPNARKSLDMAVVRLRRLLQSEDALVVAEGRLRLAGTHVWTDVRPLMTALASARARRDEHAQGSAVEAAVAAAEITAVLDHFRGPFLPEEAETPWVLAAREAIASAVRAALMIADALLAGSNDEVLLPALERAHGADPTSEDLTRALMRVHGRAGRPAEVMRVYRRLRDMLSIVLGVAPSAQLQALHASIMSGAHAGGAPERASWSRAPTRP